MKRILFFLLLVSSFASAQVGNYYIAKPVVSNIITIDSSSKVGNIYDSSAWTTLYYFVGSLGTNFSVSSGKILTSNYSSGTGTLEFPYATMLDQETVQIDYKYKTKNAADYGVYVNWNSVGNVSQSKADLNTYLSITGADAGKVIITSTFNGSSTVYKASHAIASISIDDSISVITNNNAYGTSVIAKNWTTGDTSSLTILLNYTYPGAGVEHNTAKLQINTTGLANSTVQICRIKWSSNDPKGAQAVIRGNSIYDGSFAGTNGGRVSSLTNMICQCGPGDVSAAYVSGLHELIYGLQPKNVFIELTGNDLGFAISTTTTHNNYIAIHDSLVAHGIGVYWIYGTPRNSINVTTLNAWANGAYPFQSIDLYTPLWSGSGTGLSATYNAGDGTHINPAGNILMANTIKASSFYAAIANGNYIAYVNDPALSGVGFNDNAYANAKFVKGFQDSLKHMPVDISNNTAGNVLAYNPVSGFYLTPGGGGGGLTGLTTTRIPIATSATTVADNANLYYSSGLHTDNLIIDHSGGISAKYYNSSSSGTLTQIDLYPNSGTNVNMIQRYIPKGSGGTEFVLFNTDFVADGTNFGYLDFQSSVTNGSAIASLKSGTATAQPLKLYTSTNTNQFILGVNGSVRMGNYGVGTYTGTVAKAAGWDASGNLIEFSPGSTTAPLNLGSYYTGGYGVLQGDAVIQSNDATNTFFGNNAQIVSGAYKYIKTAAASIMYTGATPGVALLTAPSGTAGTTISWSTNLYGWTNGHVALASSTDNGFVSLPAGTSSFSQLNLPSGTLKSSIADGDLTHTTGHLYFRDQSTTYDLLAAGLTLAEGTYTPTLTNTLNIASSSVTSVNYHRIGNTVFVSIGIGVTPTAGATVSSITFTLPIATVSGTQGQVGVATFGDNAGANGYTGGSVGIVSTTTGRIYFTPSGTAAGVLQGTFAYKLN